MTDELSRRDQSDSEPYPGYANVKPMMTPYGVPDYDGSYARYLDSLEPCPNCGRVDEMDNIEGRSLCAACSLDERDAGEWDEWDDDEGLQS